MGLKGNRKGISPVIATILMVMITVGLVAFSYTWFMGMGQQAQQQTGSQLSSMEKSQQSFSIPTAYECSDGDICFELRASSMNTKSIPMNSSYIHVYIDNEPVNLNAWDGGVGGDSCNTYSGNLAAGSSCYGKVTVPGGCSSGETPVLKISHTWGASKMQSVNCE